MMKKVALYGSLLALFGATAAFGAGQFPGYPLATSSPITGNATTLPLTGNETIPADTNLTQSYPGPNGTVITGSIQPQTEVIQTSQLRAYVLSGSSVATYVLTSTQTIATLPSCTAALQGARAVVTDGTAYATGTYGSAVSATGAVTRAVVCTNTGGATTYAWAYN
jgi:hypothetical protein